MDDLIHFLTPPNPCGTVYVFGVKRPKDSEPWYLAFTNQELADNYPNRVTGVTAVLLYDRQPEDCGHSASSNVSTTGD